MKLIEPTIERLVQKPGIAGMYEMIDIVAGVSHNRHTPHDNPKKFVESLIERGHMTPLESGTVYLKVDDEYDAECLMDYTEYYRQWCIYTSNNGISYFTTNYRVLVECTCLEFMNYWCEPTEYHKQRHCYRIILNRAIADDFARHRSLSPMMRTSRRLNKEPEVVAPRWLHEMYPDVKSDEMEQWLWTLIEGKEVMKGTDLAAYHWWYSMNRSCHDYITLNNFLKPEDARGVLPPDFATEMTLCGFYGVEGQGWDNFFKQRCDKQAHPAAQYLAYTVYKDIQSQR